MSIVRGGLRLALGRSLLCPLHIFQGCPQPLNSHIRSQSTIVSEAEQASRLAGAVVVVAMEPFRTRFLCCPANPASLQSTVELHERRVIHLLENGAVSGVAFGWPQLPTESAFLNGGRVGVTALAASRLLLTRPALSSCHLPGACGRKRLTAAPITSRRIGFIAIRAHGDTLRDFNQVKVATVEALESRLVCALVCANHYRLHTAKSESASRP